MIPGLIPRLLMVVALFAWGVVCAAMGHFFIGTMIHVTVVGYLLAGTLNPSSRLFGPSCFRLGAE